MELELETEGEEQQSCKTQALACARVFQLRGSSEADHAFLKGKSPSIRFPAVFCWGYPSEEPQTTLQFPEGLRERYLFLVFIPAAIAFGTTFV